ncbi:hypothetical protein OC835_006887 [Tilletia horrida]|nr:hypothetical protein OC835_006887 [Tilletia horrida]
MESSAYAPPSPFFADARVMSSGGSPSAFDSSFASSTSAGVDNEADQPLQSQLADFINSQDMQAHFGAMTSPVSGLVDQVPLQWSGPHSQQPGRFEAYPPVQNMSLGQSLQHGSFSQPTTSGGQYHAPQQLAHLPHGLAQPLSSSGTIHHTAFPPQGTMIQHQHPSSAQRPQITVHAVQHPSPVPHTSQSPNDMAGFRHSPAPITPRPPTGHAGPHPDGRSLPRPVHYGAHLAEGSPGSSASGFSQGRVNNAGDSRVAGLVMSAAGTAGPAAASRRVAGRTLTRAAGDNSLTDKHRDFMTNEIKAQVDGSFASLQGWVEKKISEHVRSAMHDYASVVSAFRSAKLKIGQGLDAVARQSDDGAFYFCLNNADLDAYVEQCTSLEKSTDAKYKLVMAKITELEGVIASQGGSTQQTRAPLMQKDVNTLGAAPSGTHLWSTAKGYFRDSVASLAGIPTSKTGTPKIWQLDFVPNQIEFHEPGFIPPVGYVVPPAVYVTSAGAGTGNNKGRVPILRFDFNVAWDELPNKLLLQPILEAMVKNPKHYGVPQGLTHQELMRQVLKSTWDGWAGDFKKREKLGETEVKRLEELRKQDSRRRKRLTDKSKRRKQASEELTLRNPTRANTDCTDSVLFSVGWQSDELSERRIDSDGVEVEEVVIRDPAVRSIQAAKILHDLDAHVFSKAKVNRKRPRELNLVRSERQFDLPEGETVTWDAPRWAVREAYVLAFPHRVPVLKQNVGPFTGPRAVAAGPKSFGSGMLCLGALPEGRTAAAAQAPSQTASSSSTSMSSGGRDGVRGRAAAIGHERHTERQQGPSPALGLSGEGQTTHTPSSAARVGLAVAMGFGRVGSSAAVNVAERAAYKVAEDGDGDDENEGEEEEDQDEEGDGW